MLAAVAIAMEANRGGAVMVEAGTAVEMVPAAVEMVLACDLLA
jgi:hypothetical protein